MQNTPKVRQKLAFQDVYPLFNRSCGKFSVNLSSYLVNFTVTRTLQMDNFKVFVSKNRNLTSEHSRAAPHRLSEHLAGSAHPPSEHLHSFHGTSPPAPNAPAQQLKMRSPTQTYGAQPSRPPTLSWAHELPESSTPFRATSSTFSSRAGLLRANSASSANPANSAVRPTCRSARSPPDAPRDSSLHR
jgi:hypothetical protein